MTMFQINNETYGYNWYNQASHTCAVSEKLPINTGLLYSIHNFLTGKNSMVLCAVITGFSCHGLTQYKQPLYHDQYLQFKVTLLNIHRKIRIIWMVNTSLRLAPVLNNCKQYRKVVGKQVMSRSKGLEKLPNLCL